MVDQDCERELPGTFALVCPFKAVFCKTFDLVVLVEVVAFHCYFQPVDRALAFVDFHGLNDTVHGSRGARPSERPADNSGTSNIACQELINYQYFSRQCAGKIPAPHWLVRDAMH